MRARVGIVNQSNSVCTHGLLTSDCLQCMRGFPVYVTWENGSISYPHSIGVYYVSEIASLCLRQVFYARTNPHEQEADSSIWRMYVGSAIHRSLTYDTRTWRELRVRVHISVGDEFVEIVGRVDNYDPETGTVIDHKITHCLDWQMKSNNIPHEHAVKQIQIYGWILRERYGIPVYHQLLMYSDDSTLPVPVEVKWHNMKDWVKKRVELLHHALKANVPPPQEVGWWCRRCFFADICKRRIIENP